LLGAVMRPDHGGVRWQLLRLMLSVRARLANTPIVPTFIDTVVPWLYPVEFRAVRRWHAARACRRARDELAAATARLSTVLPYALAGEAHAELVHRVKTPCSTFEKAAVRGKRIDDLLALRVILDAPSTRAAEDDAMCYSVQHVLESLWPGSVALEHDYVADPKPNSYQALHLSVQLPDSGNKIEVQVRTRQMHERAEHGEAAHSAYKTAAILDSRRRPRARFQLPHLLP